MSGTRTTPLARSTSGSVTLRILPTSLQIFLCYTASIDGAALGVEAVNCVAPENRDSALGVFTAFADLSLGLIGPVAGLIVAGPGYSPIFLFAAVMAAAALGLMLILGNRPAFAPHAEFVAAD